MTDLKHDGTVMESQEAIRDILHEAVGIYMAKEPSEKDMWRKKSIWDIHNHLRHEVEEIIVSNTFDRRYHNILDAIGLLAIYAFKVKEDSKK